MHVDYANIYTALVHHKHASTKTRRQNVKPKKQVDHHQICLGGRRMGTFALSLLPIYVYREMRCSRSSRRNLMSKTSLLNSKINFWSVARASKMIWKPSSSVILG